jgi:hypothetical protein
LLFSINGSKPNFGPNLLFLQQQNSMAAAKQHGRGGALKEEAATDVLIKSPRSGGGAGIGRP